MRLVYLFSLLILVNSCISNKSRVAVFRDDGDNNCVRLRKDTVVFLGRQYDKIYLQKCNRYYDQKLTYSDFNVGVLYFRKSNDSVLFVQQQTIGLPFNNFNKVYEQVLFVMSDTIGTHRRINIDDFMVFELWLSNIILDQEGRKNYEFSFKYIRRSSHLGRLENLKINSIGNVIDMTYRMDGDRLFKFYKHK